MFLSPSLIVMTLIRECTSLWVRTGIEPRDAIRTCWNRKQYSHTASQEKWIASFKIGTDPHENLQRLNDRLWITISYHNSQILENNHIQIKSQSRIVHLHKNKLSQTQTSSESRFYASSQRDHIDHIYFSQRKYSILLITQDLAQKNMISLSQNHMNQWDSPDEDEDNTRIATNSDPRMNTKMNTMTNTIELSNGRNTGMDHRSRIDGCSDTIIGWIRARVWKGRDERNRENWEQSLLFWIFLNQKLQSISFRHLFIRSHTKQSIKHNNQLQAN